ncbi:fibronectin type III domain-containing protein [Streptomyces sp. SID13031]|uniref:fibronectin type III domain-containing protein n=1 Tax=Streptomyces sp. SID13031 TaxID=2706046 RepID=UPI0013C89415|nr:fibronectin type III domain-containing protein [Streptomyces sp. SID13031]NEA30916.1 fibronectin type III domain-containing protein [Streptomyces sp. SID13031]
MKHLAIAATVLAALTGCSSTGQSAGTHAPSLQLSATLDTPTDITLSWSGAPADSTSTIVEFATEPEGRYTILDFVSADQQLYKHPDLMPKTPFYYRVTPVLGPASTPVEVKLPAATIFHSVSENTAPDSPTEIAAKSVGKDGVRVTWKDNATDEDGYLLEIKPQGQPTYRVAGFIDPDSTFTELTTLPAERTASYRIRAFHRGTPSNLAHQTTGAD